MMLVVKYHAHCSFVCCNKWHVVRWNGWPNRIIALVVNPFVFLSPTCPPGQEYSHQQQP